MALTKVTYSMIVGAPLTPQDFGAVGNGVADDTAALQAMFAENKPWYIPDGTYLINDTLTIGADGECDVVNDFLRASADVSSSLEVSILASHVAGDCSS